MSFFIGNVEIKKKVILAPMAGITSFSYRKLYSRFGCGLTYTEMISDCGLIYHNTNTYELLKSDGSDRPLAIQLFGGSKDTLLKGIDELEKLNIKYDILDLNLACPVPKVTKNNGGSSWLLDQEKLYDMVSAVVKRSTKPVSAKIRIGFKEVNVNQTVQTLERAGISFIAIHARTREQLYSGKPHFEELKDVRDLIKIPFCISGDIYTPEDASFALEVTRADAVMVARGGIGNPKLISNINTFLETGTYDSTISYDEQKDYLIEYAKNLSEELGERKAASILRGIAPKFFLKIPGTKPLRIQITQTLNSVYELIEIVKKFHVEK